MVSKLTYFSYAVSYAEIQLLMNEGPSNKMDDELNKNELPRLISFVFQK